MKTPNTLNIPAGTYPGKLTGYDLTVELPTKLYFVEVAEGIRGSMRCVIVVTESEISWETC